MLLGDNDRTHYPILPGVLPSENEVDEYYLTGWEGNPLNSFAGLLNITQVHDVVVTGEGTLDCDAQNGDWWVDPKVKRIAWRPRAVAMVDSEKVCLHLHRIGGAGQQGEQGEHVGVAGFVYRLSLIHI